MAIGEEFEGIAEDAKKLPWWGWVILALVLFLVAQHFGLLGGGSTTNAPSSDSAALTDSTPQVYGDQTGVSGDSSGSGINSGPQPPAPAPTPNPPPPATKPPPPPSKPPTHKTYTVRSGDTLAEIADREGVNWQTLYSANQGIIEATARQHGFGSSDHGHWIFPGERLVIPA